MTSHDVQMVQEDTHLAPAIPLCQLQALSAPQFGAGRAQQHCRPAPPASLYGSGWSSLRIATSDMGILWASRYGSWRTFRRYPQIFLRSLLDSIGRHCTEADDPTQKNPQRCGFRCVFWTFCTSSNDALVPRGASKRQQQRGIQGAIEKLTVKVTAPGARHSGNPAFIERRRSRS